MAKTYTLNSTSIVGGMRSSWLNSYWTGYKQNTENRVGGYSSGTRFATYIMFDQTQLAILRSKTVTSITLNITIASGRVLGSGYNEISLAYKLNNQTASTSENNAWERGNANSTEASTASIGWLKSSTTQPFDANNTPFSFNLTGTSVPVYGYVIGPDYSATATSAVIASSATLVVTTNETDYTYTLSYNANGGSGAPSSQQQTVAATTAPSMTFTISSVSPSREGYTFKGWATSSTATSASYQPNGSISVSGNTTLYAVWQVITYTVSYNANGGTGAPTAQTKTYGQSITLSSTAPTRTGYLFQGWATSSTGAVAYQPSGTYSTNASVVLYAIWKAANSTLSSVDNTAIGASGTASWNKIDNAFTYKLVITYSNAPAVTVNVAANSSSTTFTIPTTWYAYLPNSTSVTATATLTTYSGSTALGSSAKNFTVSVAASVKPSISAFTASPHSSNTTVNGWNVYVQGYSYVSLSATATAGTGASIVSYAFSGEGLSQTGTGNTANSSVIDTSGAKEYKVVVTDTRGRTTLATVTVNFHAYSAPVVTSLTSYRSNSSGDPAGIDGTYIHTTPVFSYSAVGNNQLTTKKIEYKLHTASSWTTGVSSATSGTGYTFGNGNIAITSSYDVKCTVTDSLGNSGYLVVLVPPIVGFAIGLNNDRARFGGPVEKAGLQVDWNAEFNGVVDVTPRRCYATLSTPGWYRVLTYNATSAQEARGNMGRIFDFSITRTYTTAGNEVHKISLLNPYYRGAFVDESSYAITPLVSQIRVTCNETDNKLNVDIRYVGTSENRVTVDFVMHTEPTTYGKCVAAGLVGVDPSPSGETELANYTFAANTIGPVPISTTATSVGGTISVPSMDKYRMLFALTNTSTSNPVGTRGVVTIPVQAFGQVNIPVCTESQTSYIRVQTSGDTLYYTASGISGMYILNLYGIV